jgi:hypothetical protein
MNVNPSIFSYDYPFLSLDQPNETINCQAEDIFMVMLIILSGWSHVDI